MFAGCQSLQFLDLSSASLPGDADTMGALVGCPKDMELTTQDPLLLAAFQENLNFVMP